MVRGAVCHHYLSLSFVLRLTYSYKQFISKVEEIASAIFFADQDLGRKNVNDMTDTAPEPHAEMASEPDHTRFVDHYLAFLLAQASSRISREFHRDVEAAGLSVTEWRVLASLEGSEGESIGVLSQLTLTKQPTLSKVVQRMEADGIVDRTRVRSDRRQTVVRITPKGHLLTESLRTRAINHQARLLEPFGQENAEMLISMLRDLLALHPASGPIDEEADS